MPSKIYIKPRKPEFIVFKPNGCRLKAEGEFVDAVDDLLRVPVRLSVGEVFEQVFEHPCRGSGGGYEFAYRATVGKKAVPTVDGEVLL